MKNKRRKKLLIVLLAVLALLCACGIYLGTYYHASQEARMAAESCARDVKIEGRDVMFFGPEDADTAIIFYPGGKVQCEAYAPLCKELGDWGILCALVKMPCNLALFAPHAGGDVKDYIDRGYHCDSCYLCGHSLGGAMACELAYAEPDAFDGIILLAAYSAKDLSNTDLRILSIYGSEDMVLSKDKYDSGANFMPSDFTESVLYGGCHSFFGDYGTQKGDGVPAISREDQLEQCVSFIVNWIN